MIEVRGGASLQKKQKRQKKKHKKYNNTIFTSARTHQSKGDGGVSGDKYLRRVGRRKGK